MMDVVVISCKKGSIGNMPGLLLEMAEVRGVTIFDDTGKAEEYLKKHKADFVILDADDADTGWIIPFKRMKAFNPGLKVALMSSIREDAVKAYASGVWDYLLKPVKESQLKRIVAKCG